MELHSVPEIKPELISAQALRDQTWLDPSVFHGQSESSCYWACLKDHAPSDSLALDLHPSLASRRSIEGQLCPPDNRASESRVGCFAALRRRAAGRRSGATENKPPDWLRVESDPGHASGGLDAATAANRAGLPAQVQAVANKLDELLAALQTRREPFALRLPWFRRQALKSHLRQGTVST